MKSVGLSVTPKPRPSELGSSSVLTSIRPAAVQGLCPLLSGRLSDQIAAAGRPKLKVRIKQLPVAPVAMATSVPSAETVNSPGEETTNLWDEAQLTTQHVYFLQARVFWSERGGTLATLRLLLPTTTFAHRLNSRRRRHE